MDEKETLRVIARTLYLSGPWQQLPWGVKQILSGYIQDLIEEERRLSIQPAPKPEPPKPQPKRREPTPWDK